MLKHHVIIIDDRLGCQNELVQAFERDPLFDIEFHQSVLNCLSKTSREPHMIVVEHKMIQMDGICAIKMLRKRWRKARIVLKGVSSKGCKRINRKKYKINQTLPVADDSSLLIEEIKWNGAFWKMKWRVVQFLFAIILFMLPIVYFMDYV